MRILYEDPYLLAVEKPAGMLSQPDATGDEDLLTEVRKYQTEREDRYPAEVVHRLDRGTGGVILYAKGAAVAAVMSAQFRSRAVEKQYLAAVSGVPEEQEGRWADRLIHRSAGNRTNEGRRGDPAAKPASLRYRILETGTDQNGRPASLLLVTLETGRTHQIRAQASIHGFPLLGDGKYGGPGGCPMGLWAVRVRFEHPREKGRTLTMVSMPPAGSPWDLFPSAASLSLD